MRLGPPTPDRIALLLALPCLLAPSPLPASPTRVDTLETQIDRLIPPTRSHHPICPDATFLRRAHLDVIGTLPTPDEARAFLADSRPDKRPRLIDHLLARPEFADHWTNQWCDLLRVKAEFPVNLWPNAAQAYHRYVWSSLRDNKPFDLFAREILTSTGSNFRVGPVNFFRAVPSRDPAGISRSVAQVFLGSRADRWPDDRLANLSVFFSRVSYKPTAEWKEEIVFDDPSKPLPSHATFPDGTSTDLSPDRDPRESFADWLTSPDNPYFARCAANRVWYWLLGQGIVHEPDDHRPDNPPANPALLDYLAKQLITSHYDLKHLYRLILNSRTYQRSPQPSPGGPGSVRASSAFSPSPGTPGEGRGEGRPSDATFPPPTYASYHLRRLDAETLIDALCQITGTTEKYNSPIPEPFTFVPDGIRATQLPDASVTSPFLEMFGRPPRDTGLAAERNNRPTPDQRLHLINSTHLQRKLEQGPRIQSILRSKQLPRQIVQYLYLAILSRYPTEDELRIAADYARTLTGPTKNRDAAIDLAWALINTTEFLYRH